MNKLTKTIGALALLGSTIAGCGNYVQEEVSKARQVYTPGQSKVLTVKAASDIHSLGPERKFYDFNGDGKTVEQYVEDYANCGYRADITRVLLRPGFKSTFNQDDPDTHKITRTMTPTEMAKLDREYQRLLESTRF